MFNVFVFPSCNEPGLEIISSLVRSNKICLWGGSSYDVDYDPSRLLLKNFVKCPDYSDPGFRSNFQRILQDHQIDIVFPTMDILVAEFSKWRVPGTTFVTTNSETAELFLSKAQTYERLKNVSPVPEIYTGNDVRYPAYAKPDQGSGSRGHMLITDGDEWKQAQKRGLLISEYLPGPEYTVDCINDTGGRLLFSNVRVRGQIGRGIALGTRGIIRPEISEYIKGIVNTIRIEGPWFAQFKESSNGEPKLMEINARIAGSMALTRLAGVNIPLMSVFLYKGFDVEVPRIRNNVLLNRSLRNLGEGKDFAWVVWDLDDTVLRKDGKPDPDVVACLYDFNNRGIKQLMLTKNPDVKELIKLHNIPDFFIEIRTTNDKMVEFEGLVRTHAIKVEECVIVNDSYSENLAINKGFPQLRTLTPDVVELLGREKL